MQTSTPWEVTAYAYPHGLDPAPSQWTGLAEMAPVEAAPVASEDSRTDTAAHNAEQVRAAFDAGREQGRREGRTAEQAVLASERADRVRQMAALLENFAREQERYLLAVEREVVELALAIAARILRREAQMDPLLLTGAVRVALGQLAEGAEARLRVPQADAALWQEAIAHLPSLAVRPEVAAGAEMRLGECVLETRLGSVDLGLRAQLGEIERGFFDSTSRTRRGEAHEEAQA